MNEFKLTPKAWAGRIAELQTIIDGAFVAKVDGVNERVASLTDLKRIVALMRKDLDEYSHEFTNSQCKGW